MRSSIRSAIEASGRRLLARRETLLALISFGASSVYWLALAFLLPAASYGKMMTLQASVTLITTILTLRIFDLLFYLIGKRGYRPDTGFRVAFGCEVLSVLTATLVCAIGATFFHQAGPGIGAVAGVAALAFVSAAATAQGASVARLRYEKRPDAISRADYVAIASWTLAGLSLFVLVHYPPIVLLIVGMLPPTARSAALLWEVRHPTPGDGKDRFDRKDLVPIIHFLWGGQMVNFVKNSGVSVETMIVAAFCPPTSVAMYRLARATQGPTNAASNVSYQQGYSDLAHATTPERKEKVVKRMRREGTRIWLAMYPISAGFALLYALHKPDVGVVTLQLVTIGAMVGFLPSVLQQGPKALLLIEGSHRDVNTGFVIGLAGLALLSSLMFVLPSLLVFLVALIASSFARYAYLAWKARSHFRSGAAQGALAEAIEPPLPD